MVERQYSDRALPSAQRRRRGVGEGMGCALDQVFSPPLTPLYIGEGGKGGRPSRENPRGGGAAAKGRGGEGGLPPKPGGRPL